MSDIPVEERLARLVRTAKIDDKGLGEVWLANSADHGEVVIKIFDPAGTDAPALAARFRRALPFLLQHSCAHLPQVFDGGTLDVGAFLVLERVAAVSLARTMDATAEDAAALFDARGPKVENGRIDSVDACRIALGFLDALSAALAHRDLERDVATPVVHGALTARKVLIGRGGHVTLLGLGTAPLSRTGPLTDPAAFDTAAPEQARGDPATERSDVYAAGALLFRMLSGKSPVPDGSIVKRIRALVKGGTPALSEVCDAPEGLARVVDRALAARPDDRFASAVEMHDALLDWISETEEANHSVRTEEALTWALDAVRRGDTADVAQLLLDRPELSRSAALTGAIWDEVADDALAPLFRGFPLTRVQATLLARLPEAAPDLIGLVADTEICEMVRVASARVLGTMGAQEAAPYLVRTLNEPYPWLQNATLWALAKMPQPQPISLADGGRLAPCQRQWDELEAGEGEMRTCAQCERQCVLTFQQVHSASVQIMTLTGERVLENNDVLLMGSDPDADVFHPKLDRHHAELSILSDGRVIIRRVGSDVREGDLEEVALTPDPDDEGQRIRIGPLDVMTRIGEAVLIIHAQDGDLELRGATDVPLGDSRGIFIGDPSTHADDPWADVVDANGPQGTRAGGTPESAATTPTGRSAQRTSKRGVLGGIRKWVGRKE